MMSDHELRLKVEQELESLKMNYPKKNLLTPRAQQILEKIRWLEYLLDLQHVTIKELVVQPEPQREAPELAICMA